MIVSLSSKWALGAETSFIKWDHFFILPFWYNRFKLILLMKIAFYIAEIKLVQASTYFPIHCQVWYSVEAICRKFTYLVLKYGFKPS